MTSTLYLFKLQWKIMILISRFKIILNEKLTYFLFNIKLYWTFDKENQVYNGFSATWTLLQHIKAKKPNPRDFVTFEICLRSKGRVDLI